MTKAYLIVEHIITDAEKFEEYRAKVGPMIAKHFAEYAPEPNPETSYFIRAK
jgi:uncharacterized protein (DUF1330 family)